MPAESLFHRITQIEKKLTRDVESAERAQLALIEAHRATVRKKMREAIEETPDMRRARETIERLQLRLELLRNIKMNWRGFQLGLRRKGMNMRINQHAHLEHLIAFLETGQGVLMHDDGEGLLNDPEKALMTYEVQPTGAGKTGAFAIDIALMDVPSLTLVPFDSLLEQTKKDMIKIGNVTEDQIGLVGGGRKEIGRKHTIATYAGHAALMKNGGAYAHFIKTQCKFVICDEVHHQALGDRMQDSIEDIDGLSNGTPTEEELEMLNAEKDVIFHLNEQTGVKSLKIGFTATPRGSKKHVRKYFPHCLGRVYHKEMVSAGLVVPYRIVQCDGSVFEGEMEKYMNQDDEIAILERERIYSKLVGQYAEVLTAYRDVKRKQTEMPMRGMAFCTSHAECEKFSKEAESHGLRCRIVTGKEARGIAGQAVINEAVDALLAEEIDLIVTVEKLATGFNRAEINAIVSARITSAAKTVQYIGRGARSHTDERGCEKKHCMVFETNWTLKNNAKKGRRPLRLADALAYNGEEPEAICSMADGSPLQVNRNLTLEKDGTIDIGGRLAVGLNAYADANLAPLSPITLIKLVAEAGLQPASEKQVGGLGNGKKINVYWKDEVDRLVPKRIDQKTGTVDINGRQAIGIASYAKAQNIDNMTMELRITEAKLQPVPNVKVFSGYSTIDVYWKDEVDRLVPKRIDQKTGTVDINGRQAIGIASYAKAQDPEIYLRTLKSLVEAAGLQPVPNVRVLSNTIPVEVYWKDEVDVLLPKRLNDQGIVNIEGRDAVGLSAYAPTINVTCGALNNWTSDFGLQPISNVLVLNGKQFIKVYWKDEVDKIIPKRLKNGVVEINGREAVGLPGYANALGSISAVTLIKYVQEAGLQPISDVHILNGVRKIDVYWKNEVDTVLKIRGIK